MITKKETRFWEKHAENGVLIRAVRAEKERAIKFFGGRAVITENEGMLLKILDARQIIQKNEGDLLKEMNGIPKAILSTTNRFTDDEVKSIRQRLFFKSEDIKALKQKAQHFLSSF